eukprot:73117-Prymnesium_polylepis.1
MAQRAALLVVLLLHACEALRVAPLRAAPPRAPRACAPAALEFGVPTNMAPLNDNVVIEISNVPAKTTSGILLPT